MSVYVRPGDHRERDGLGRLAPRNIMADPVVLARALPGLAGVFDRRVPKSRTLKHSVRCACGAETPLEAGMEACAGGCGRRFWRVGDVVRVAQA